MSEATFIKQYGHQRSGTNAIKALIETNFVNVHVLPNYLGDKHGAFGEQIEQLNDTASIATDHLDSSLLEEAMAAVKSGSIRFVINYKNLIPWLVSYHRYQKKKVLFLNPEADFPFTRDFIVKASENWREAVFSWYRLADEHSERCVIIEHEQVLGDTGDLMSTMEAKFGLTRRNDELITTMPGYAKRGTGKERGEDIINSKMKFNRDYHLLDQWKSSYDDDLYECAVRELEKALVESPDLAKLPNWRGDCR